MNLKNNPDLTAWLTNPEQALPESLKMAFVDRALEVVTKIYLISQYVSL